MKNLEIWVDVLGYDGYNGLYQVSSNSRIRNLKGKIISKSKDSAGYLKVNFYKNGKKRTISTHTIIAKHFIPNPNNLKVVEHKNDNKDDDSIENLMWSTTSNNTINSYYRGDKNRIKAVLQYDLHGNFINEFESVRKACRHMNSGSNNITPVCQGKKESAYGYIWRYK